MPLGGLGRFIFDGSQVILDLKYGYPAMLAAGITVAVLAVLADGVSASCSDMSCPLVCPAGAPTSAVRRTATPAAEAQLADA